MKILIVSVLIACSLADPRIDDSQPYAAQTRHAAEAAQVAALQAAAASSAAAAHAVAFRKDPDLAKYQQYLDILRAHYGIQLPMNPNIDAQQSTSIPNVQSYPVASISQSTSRPTNIFAKYTSTPAASSYYSQQPAATHSYYPYSSAPQQTYQPPYSNSNSASVASSVASYPDQTQQQKSAAAAAAAYASYANQAAYGTQQPVQQPQQSQYSSQPTVATSYSSYGQYSQQPQPVQPVQQAVEYSYPVAPTQSPATAAAAATSYSSYNQYGSQQSQQPSGYVNQYGQYGQQPEYGSQPASGYGSQSASEYGGQPAIGYGQEYVQQPAAAVAAPAAVTQPPAAGTYTAPSSVTRPDPRVVIAYPPAISGKANPMQPEQQQSTHSVSAHSSYPQEYSKLPRQPLLVQRPMERPRPADPRDYNYSQQPVVEELRPVQQVQQPTRVTEEPSSPMEWWDRVSSVIAHEISVKTTPKYIVPIIPATTPRPAPVPAPQPINPYEQPGYVPSLPSQPIVPINPVEPPKMVPQQPPVIYTGAAFPTPGDLPTPTQSTSSPSYRTPLPPSSPPPSPSPFPSPSTPSIVHPSSIQTPHVSSATAAPVPAPKSVKPATKEGKAAATSREALAEQIRSLPAVLYTKSSATKRVEKILRAKGLPLVSLYIDKVEGRETQIQKHLEHLTGSSTMPFLFICGTYIGSEEHVEDYDKKGQMEQLVEYVCKGSKEVKKKNKKDKRKKGE